MGMNKERLFTRSGGEGLDYTISADDINSISFEDAIREAVEQGITGLQYGYFTFNP
jgi:hypothetical protein